MGDAMFSPLAADAENVGFTFSAGVLGRRRHVPVPPVGVAGAARRRWRAFVGETVGNQVDVIYAGGGFNAFLFPTSPVTPFVGGRGRRRLRPQEGRPVRRSETGNYSMVNVGGGLLVALKKRLTLRGDVRHYVIFDANHTQRIQEYSGALAVYF